MLSGRPLPPKLVPVEVPPVIAERSHSETIRDTALSATNKTNNRASSASFSIPVCLNRSLFTKVVSMSRLNALHPQA
jgi:hypothetical protein